MVWPADSGSPFAWKIRVASSGVSKEASLFNRTRSGFERSYMTLGGFAWRSRFKNTPLLHASRYMDHGTELISRTRASWKYQLSNTTKTSGWMLESSRAMGEYAADKYDKQSRSTLSQRTDSGRMRMCRGEGWRRKRREGRRIARISLRRADRGEVKTKRADWQDLLSAGQPTTSEWSVLQVRSCGPILRIPRTPTDGATRTRKNNRSCLRDG